MWAEQEPQQLMILDGGSIFSDLLSLVVQLKKNQTNKQLILILP